MLMFLELKMYCPFLGYAPAETMEGYGSPKKTTKPMSSIPQALAHGAMAMAHMDPMHGQMTVMQGQVRQSI